MCFWGPVVTVPQAGSLCSSEMPPSACAAETWRDPGVFFKAEVIISVCNNSWAQIKWNKGTGSEQ